MASVLQSISIHVVDTRLQNFQKPGNEYKKRLLKKDDEKTQYDDIFLSNRYSDHCILIADSAYQSADQHLRAVMKKNKLTKGLMTNLTKALICSIVKTVSAVIVGC
jgi:nicotinamide mononucleotide adenylyltransferase